MTFHTPNQIANQAEPRETEQRPLTLADCTEVYAVPGEQNIVDLVHPVTGLTLYGQRTAEQVIAAYPGAVRMPFATWQADAYARQQTPIGWVPVTHKAYRDMLEVLPPAFWRGGLFLVGEPDSHCVKTGAARFAAYWEPSAGEYYRASRAITVAEARELLAATFAGAQQ